MDLQGTTPVQSTYYRARKLFMVLCVCGSVQVTRQQQEMGANSNQNPPHPGSHPCGYQLDPCWTQRNFREETTPQWRYLADYTRITTAMLHAIFTRSQYLEEATWKLEIYITAQFYETMTDMLRLYAFLHKQPPKNLSDLFEFYCQEVRSKHG